MRIALAVTLMSAMATGWATEPSAPKAQTEPVAKEATTTSSDTGKRPFKPPAGYKRKRINGEDIYCAKLPIYNSRLTTEDCRNEAQLREIARSNQANRNELDRLSRRCSGADCTRR